MIRVAKPVVAPAALAAGVALTAANCAAYDRDPAAYRSGAERFNFRKSVYGPTTVKNALKNAQHGKCCFCEARFAANHAGDVEHYRPKGAVKQADRTILPGYYWLAYDWRNLFYACADCNQYRKRDQFPLADEAARALSHHQALTAETPLLVDPGGTDDPRDHISFKGDVPIWKTSVGRVTIKTLKLDREELNLARRSHLHTVDLLMNIVQLLAGDQRPDAIAQVQAAREELVRFQTSEAIFSSAAQNYISSKTRKPKSRRSRAAPHS